MNICFLVSSALDAYIKAMIFVAPAICSLLCTLLILLSTRNRRSSVSRRTRTISMLSLSAVGILWLYPGLPLGFNETDGHILLIALCGVLVITIEITLSYVILRPIAGHNAFAERSLVQEAGQLTRKIIDDYFIRMQPYINPEYKLEELAEAMGVNRSDMSAFINRTFGMNFKRYVNRYRLAEYERLMSLPSNSQKNPPKIMLMAGFTDVRHYNRTIAVEQTAAAEQKAEQSKTPENNRQQTESKNNHND